MGTILVVDDELSMREMLQIALEKEGYSILLAKNGAMAMEMMKHNEYDLLLCDMKMPGVTGMEVLKKSKGLHPNIPVIIITAFSTSESAREAMKVGAYDYLQKPFDLEDVKLIIKNALERGQLIAENIQLKDYICRTHGLDNIIGESPSMLKVYELIQKTAPGKANIMITGESGTGKELVARAIHFSGPRKDSPFVTVNCGAIPENLIESELFGHKKGSFTGAVANKRGLVEAASGGTLFLDEISELDKNLQVKLLRAIQEKTITPVGGIEEVEVDVRIISASNRDLEDEVNKGNFREDLFWRLNVIHMTLPSLRERKGDIPKLAIHFLAKYTKEQGKPVSSISHGAMALLEEYDFPGNVRELENIIERAVSLEAGTVITPQSLPARLREKEEAEGVLTLKLPTEGMNLEKELADIERSLLEQAIEEAGGVKTKAAELLGLSFRSFRYRLEKFGIE